MDRSSCRRAVSRQARGPARSAVLCAVLCAALCAALVAGPARAALVDGSTQPVALAPQHFTADQAASFVTNPTFAYSNVPGYGTLSVSYGPYFEGQTASDPFSPPTSVSGAPTGPLSLALNQSVQAPPGSPDPGDYPYAWETAVESDATLPNTFVLGGTPAEIAGMPIPDSNGFGGPIALLFSEPVTGVQLTVGFFDDVGQTQIEGFLADGTSIGSVTNTGDGYETFDLADSTPGQSLSGLLITTTDPGGVGIDGVGVLEPASVPVPAPSAAVALPAILLLLSARYGVRLGGGRRRRRG